MTDDPVRVEVWRGAEGTVADRMKEVRQRRGWTAADLANRCSDLGMPGLNKSVIANIESYRRKYVSIGEVLTIAYALDVAPIHLFVPLADDEDADVTRFQVTPDRFLPVDQARAWVRGEFAPGGIDPRTYFSEVPREEFRPPKPSAEEIDARGETTRTHRDLSDRLLHRDD